MLLGKFIVTLTLLRSLLHNTMVSTCLSCLPHHVDSHLLILRGYTAVLQHKYLVFLQKVHNPDYLGFSIFNMLCCCCCIGIAAVVKSCSVRDANDRGDPNGQSASREALTLNKVALGMICQHCFGQCSERISYAKGKFTTQNYTWATTAAISYRPSYKIYENYIVRRPITTQLYHFSC